MALKSEKRSFECDIYGFINLIKRHPNIYYMVPNLVFILQPCDRDQSTTLTRLLVQDDTLLTH